VLHQFLFLGWGSRPHNPPAGVNLWILDSEIR
jgi:hypothetical protein